MNSISGKYKRCLLCRRLFFLVLILLSLSSCTTKRHIFKEPIKEEGPDYLFSQLSENELKFTSFSAKFSIDYIHNKKKTEFKGQIRILKDSVIWVSFSPALGIEMARIMITNDSVKFMNRLDNTYFMGDYDFVNKFLETNIDFDILQSFVIGNDFQFYDKTKFRASLDGGQYRLTTMERSKLKKYVKEKEIYPKVFIQTIWLNPENFKITQIMIKEIKKENKKLDAYYSDFQSVENQLFPYKLKFELSAEEQIEVFVNYSRINLNEPLNFPFRVPEKFERIH